MHDHCFICIILHIKHVHLLYTRTQKRTYTNTTYTEQQEDENNIQKKYD